jgi:hypothetical protein
VRVASVLGWLLVLAFAVALIVPADCVAAVKDVDEFDQYVDDADLRASWVVSNTKDTVFVKTPGYQVSTQSMKIRYNNAADPWWTAVSMTFPSVQDWSEFRRFACRFIGFYPDDNPTGNSGERFFLRIYDQWGGYVDGPKISNATKTYEWVYYDMDISMWPERSNVASIAVILEAEDYGTGQFYVDRIHVDTMPPVLDDYETYADTDELRESWLYGGNNLNYLMAEPTADGPAWQGDQFLRLDYLCSIAPYQADLTLEFDFQEDWSDYETLKLHYRGRPDLLNSSEGMVVILEDIYGGTYSGPLVSGATQCPFVGDVYCDWHEYVMDFSSWASRGFIKKVIVRLVAESYGDGRLYLDEILLSGPSIPARQVSWGELKAKYRK